MSIKLTFAVTSGAVVVSTAVSAMVVYRETLKKNVQIKCGECTGRGEVGDGRTWGGRVNQIWLNLRTERRVATAAAASLTSDWTRAQERKAVLWFDWRSYCQLFSKSRLLSVPPIMRSCFLIGGVVRLPFTRPFKIMLCGHMEDLVTTI